MRKWQINNRLNSEQYCQPAPVNVILQNSKISKWSCRFFVSCICILLFYIVKITLRLSQLVVTSFCTTCTFVIIACIVKRRASSIWIMEIHVVINIYNFQMHCYTSNFAWSDSIITINQLHKSMWLIFSRWIKSWRWFPEKDGPSFSQPPWPKRL